MKKRNKKYNPNKLVQLVQREALKPYELWMSFEAVEVEEACQKYNAMGLTKSEVINKIYALHDGDLIVPLINNLTKDAYEFFVGIDSYYYHEDDPSNIIDDARQFELPVMKWDEFRVGGNPDLKIMDGDIKRRWKGISEEMDDIHAEYRKKGYKLFKSLTYIKTEVIFRDIEAYNIFKAERVVRGMCRKYELQGAAA